jgi:hypothetical protein
MKESYDPVPSAASWDGLKQHLALLLSQRSSLRYIEARKTARNKKSNFQFCFG